MKKVFLFGDCHSNRIWEHHDPELSDFELKIWGKGGIKAYGIDFDQFALDNTPSTGFEALKNKRTLELIRNNKFDLNVTFNDSDNADLVLLWLGYVDSRLFLTKYHNAEIVVKEYVEKTLKYFEGKKIRFIEPLPQFKQMILKYEGISETYSYEDRLLENNNFIKFLRQYSKQYQLMPPISQEDIYGAIGVKELTVSMTHDKAPHPVDGLQDEYNQKIYNFFIDEISKTLKFYNI